jgi:hypothetical protein
VKRRTFVKAGFFGGALLALGGGALSFALLPTRQVAKATRPLRVFGDREFQILVAVSRRVVTSLDTDHVEIAEGIDDLATRLPVEAQRDLRRLLSLFESALGGLLLDGHFLPFTRLSPEKQDDVLGRWRTSSLALRRVAYQSLKKLCYLAQYSQPSSWPSVHFPTPAPVSGPYDDSKMGTPSWLEERGLGDVP